LKRYKESIEWSGKALAMSYDKHNPGQLFLYGRLQISNLINLNQAGNALILLNKIVKTTPPAAEDERILVYQSYGEIYDALKDYGKAKLNYANMIDVIENHRKDRGIVNQFIIINNHIVDYLTVVKFFISVKDYNKATHYLKKIEVFSDTLESPLLKKDINLYGFILDSVSGNYISAIKHYQQYKKIDDSIFSAAKSKQIAETDIKYQTAQRLSAIERLKNREEAQKAELQKVTLQKNITFGGIAAFMILAGLAYNGYRNKHKSNKLLHGKQAEINRQNSNLQQLLSDKDELLTEKDWLLQEVHHRVKNNLQIVMSLLSTQSAFLENKDALDAINQSRDRVYAISLIHQKLYGTKNASKIDLPSYVADLVQYLKDSFNVFERKIIISYSVQDIDIDIAQIVPLGLILNEAITNAIKYAFDSNGGKLVVDLKMVNDSSAILIVADNGKGFPDEFNPKTLSTLGMQMMVALSKQLDGTLIAQNDNGAAVIVNFQLESFRKVAERRNHVNLG
jgi:two-component sensor histidine kinase